MSITAYFFRNRLDQMIDLHHPLAVLATRVRHQMTQVVDLYRSSYFFTTTTGSFAHF
jgi:hypothetical protein